MALTKILRDSLYHVAESVASLSTCDRKHVGAIIVDDDGNVLASGFNCPPRADSHVRQGTPCSSWCQRSISGAVDTQYGLRCPSVHAEINALIHLSTHSCRKTMLVTYHPCEDCAKAIVAAGIECVVMPTQRAAHQTDVTPYFLRCGCKVEYYDG